LSKIQDVNDIEIIQSGKTGDFFILLESSAAQQGKSGCVGVCPVICALSLLAVCIMSSYCK
jgi:hypothetical protein